MARRKAPHQPDELLDQLRAGSGARAALNPGGLLDDLKTALVQRALNAEIGHHLSGADEAGNRRNGYDQMTVIMDLPARDCRTMLLSAIRLMR